MAVYRIGGRQRKRAAGTFAEARELKCAADARAAEQRLGPPLHAWALGWVDRHAGDGHDTVREFTRTEYRRLLITYALTYFDANVRLAELDRHRLHGFVNWLTHRPGREGRLSDRSIANAVTPLRACLRAAAAEGLVDEGALRGLVSPRRRGGGPWHRRPESRFLTRQELRAVLAEIPVEWRPLFDLLASTGVRISEALALRWGDLSIGLGEPRQCVHIRRAVVRGVVGPPKSRRAIRTLPIGRDLAVRLGDMRPHDAGPDELVFGRPDGAWVRIDHLRRGVLAPASERAGIAPLGLHAFRHTCAALLITRGTNPLQLQRWMGHHSAAYTLETYGHLLDDGVGPALSLEAELA